MNKFFILLCLFTFFAAPGYAGQPAPTSITIPLDQPNMDDAQVAAWAAKAASTVMTFDYLNYQQQLQHSSKLFTKSGWETFAMALQRSRIMDSMVKLKQSVTTAPAGTPEVVEQGAVSGAFQWKVKLPLKMTYWASNNGRVDTLQLILTVTRVNALENPDGVGISVWWDK